jgi:hypothetical protein
MLRGWRRRSVAAGLAAILAVLAVTTYLLVQPRGGPGPVVVPPTEIKRPLAGLVDRNGEPPSTFWPVIRSWVVDVGWRDLQPNAGGPIAADNPIDQAIAEVRKINLEHPGLNMRLRLRVFAGRYAPDWAMNLDGSPFNMTDTFDKKTAVVARYWMPGFGKAYDLLQQELAARYDGVPEIAENVMSRCTSFYPEPLIKGISIPSNRQTLLANGYTAALDMQCQKDQIDAHKVWRQTPSGMAFNPYQRIDSDGSGHVDEAATEVLMAYCRTELGTRCILENYSIRAPIERLGAAYGTMYAAMKQMGPPIAFQTAVDARIGDIGATLQWAAFQMNADSVELPGGYRTNPSYMSTNTALGHVDLGQIAAKLDQNATASVA